MCITMHGSKNVVTEMSVIIYPMVQYDCCTLRMKALQSFTMPVSIYRSTLQQEPKRLKSSERTTFIRFCWQGLLDRLDES